MVAIGSGIGASVLASQYLGAKKYGEMKTAIYTFLIAFGVLSILLALFGFLFNPSILRALKTPNNIFDDAVLYLQIYFAGLPFMFMYNILSANFNALGKSEIPLMLLIFSSLLNIGLDLWMVAGMHLGVAGVAIATVIAQGVSCVISFGILLRILGTYTVSDGDSQREFDASASDEMNGFHSVEKAKEKIKKFDGSMFMNGIKIAVPSIIQQSIVSIGMLLTQSAVNQFGSSAVAGYSAGMRLESVCIVPMIATGNAMSTFTAQNLGGAESAAGTGRLPCGVSDYYWVWCRTDFDFSAILRTDCFYVRERDGFACGICNRDGILPVCRLVLCIFGI